MQCPHCLIEIHPAVFHTAISSSSGEFCANNSDGLTSWWRVAAMACPAPTCKKAIINLIEVDNKNLSRLTQQVYPAFSLRRPPPPEVPPELAEDFKEACAVLALSPKASAALSRRCLQGILRANGFTQKDLAPAIDAAIASRQLPSILATSLDAVRNIGNFAAHPMKDSSTGVVLPVEPEEAEWNLDVIDGLFDYFHVLPAREQQKIDDINGKLAAAGKPILKRVNT